MKIGVSFMIRLTVSMICGYMVYSGIVWVNDIAITYRETMFQNQKAAE